VVERKRFDLEYKVIRINDGVERWVQGTGEIEYDGLNNPIRMFGTIQDITERKQMELFLLEKSKKIEAQNEEYLQINEKIVQTNNELIIAKEQAEESDRLKSAFLANMSHEIRTPMNGILGFAELLKEVNLSGEEQQEYIAIIEKSGIRMLNIINDIIDISKIEANLMNLDIEDSNINEQIDYIYTFFKSEVEAKGMKLSIRNSLPAKESIIKTDREKLYAILTNLVKNAIKYSHEGTIEIGYLKKDDYLEFFVSDTGIGIPKDRQEAIFERFVQADSADKMARQGAGLGLTITKAYVEMLGGKIRVESEESIGSTFYFTLPFNTQPKGITVLKIDLPFDKADHQVLNLKIMIAEDDNASEILISKFIKTLSNEIIEAKTGIEAVEICRNNPDIDLILMDIQMPEISGYEATRQIREFNKEVVIIAQTAYGLSGDREKAIEVGCNDYIAKPIKKEALLALIQKHFKER
jgi:signal transduction histidine kinase/ActR/RegA family two-component response regulator